MNKKRLLLTSSVFLCVFLFFCPVLIGDVLRVGEYQTYQKIQSAIDDAKTGDIVLIYDGIHKGEGNRDINFKGKKIKVMSKNGADNCIIDCEYRGGGFLFQSGEGQDSQLCDVTIKNGFRFICGGGIYIGRSSPFLYKVKVVACGSVKRGGGIFCMLSSPRILNCTVIDCFAYNGGGGLCLYRRGDNKVYIENSSFINNEAPFGLGLTGGGVSITSFHDVEFYKCLFRENRAAKGGGVYMQSTMNVHFNYCEFFENSAEEKGGGLYIRKSSVIMRDVEMYNNRASCEGGAIRVFSTDSEGDSYLDFTGGIIDHNIAYSGGGISLKNTVSDLSQIQFSNNDAYAIFVTTGPHPEITDCEFTNNTPTDFNY